MEKITSAHAKQAAAGVALAVLSVVPYLMIYAIDRGLGARDAARSALWPTAVVPVLVAALFVVLFVRARTSQQAEVAVQPLGQRRVPEHVA